MSFHQNIGTNVTLFQSIILFKWVIKYDNWHRLRSWGIIPNHGRWFCGFSRCVLQYDGPVPVSLHLPLFWDTFCNHHSISAMLEHFIFDKTALRFFFSFLMLFLTSDVILEMRWVLCKLLLVFKITDWANKVYNLIICV